MSNTNNNLQTQTSNALHNAIMEAGGKDRPPMLAPSNYIQWKSKIKRYIDTKPNNELIHYCVQNPPYKFKWIVKTVPVAKGSSESITEGYIENYKNVLQDIRDQLNAEAEAVQIILTGIDNGIYSTVDACPNACKMWKAIERNRGKAIVNSSTPTYDQEHIMVTKDDEMSKDKEIDKLMALISLSFKKINKPTNNNLKTSSNSSRSNQDNTPRITRGTGYDNQRVVNVVGARENVEQADWREAHYMCMAKIQEVTPDAADNSRPIFDAEPLQKLVEIILFIVNSGCSKHMTENLKLITNFVEKFLGTVKFGNDQIVPILSYGDLVQGKITNKRVYYVEGLNHNLFSVGQFCDADLEVAFRKSTCYIRDLKGNNLLTGSRGTYMYSITLQDISTPNPICLMAKATSSQA
nr:integrase, catalytic region, zinc finger, CCHC-type, peptidase aspartic, catalytic [Tanacetum cinerariifolium]